MENAKTLEELVADLQKVCDEIRKETFIQKIFCWRKPGKSRLAEALKRSEDLNK